MDDDQKWLAAAAGIEQDIGYLKAAKGARKWNEPSTGLDQDIQYLHVVLAVYKKNAATGVAWPNPDDLYCISPLPYCPQQVATTTRRDFKTAC
jgi:hypothetical protein